MADNEKTMNPLISESVGEIILYQTEDGKSRLQVRLENETVWLSQADMAELFDTSKQNISLHLKGISKEREIVQDQVVKEYLTTAVDGKKYRTKYYNLEVVIAVGYRVRSHRGTQFRQWATQRLNEYLVKGFILDDERLKEGKQWGIDYFDDLLERIRDIRASEKRFYQKIRDIYKLAVDYDPQSERTKEFFKVVQNKLHWTVSGKTAAELIADRADASKPNMGLTVWKGAKVRQGDVTIAKNYLSHEEVSELNQIVVMYLDYAEDQAKRHKLLYMKDWDEKLRAFLKFNERDILTHAGKVSMEVASQLAIQEYEKFNQRRLQADAQVEASQDDVFFEAVVQQMDQKKTDQKS